MSNMFLNIVSTFKGDGISAATRQLGAFGSAAGGLGSTLGKVGAALAGFGIAAKAVEFTKSSIDSARDLERNMFSLETVFDDMAPIMREFTQNAHEIGLSQKDAAKASVFLGSVLKQSGFSMAETTKQSQKLVSLGVDLAATYGYDVQEALLGMTALFRGEYDPIEKFGVAMKQSEINAELAARELDHLTGAARRNQEQIIRMELLYERAADATGAFTGQSGNLFVEQKKLQAQFENMQASIGNQLLPVMGALVETLVPLVDYIGPKIAQAVENSKPALKELIGFIADMSDKSTSTGQTIEMLTGLIGGFFSFVGSNFSALVELTLLFGGVTVAVNLFNAALALLNLNPVILGLTAFAAAFIWVKNVNQNLQFEVDKTAASVTSFNTTLEQSASASSYVSDKYGVVATGLSNISSQARAASENLDDVLSAMDGLSPNQAANRARRNQMRTDNRRRAALTSITSGATGGTGGTNEAARAAEKAAKELADAMEKAAKEAAKEQERIARELQDALDKAAKEEADRLQRRQDAYDAFADSVKQTFGQIKDSILSSFSLPDLGKSVNSITKNIQSLLRKTRDFAKNISTLSGQGLTNDLLQQVIQAGPLGGGALAQALVGGGSGFINQLNEAYGEFSGLAGGIAGIGTTSAFAREQVVNNFNIEVNTVAGDPIAIERVVLDAISRANRRGTTGLMV